MSIRPEDSAELRAVAEGLAELRSQVEQTLAVAIANADPEDREKLIGEVNEIWALLQGGRDGSNGALSQLRWCRDQLGYGRKPTFREEFLQHRTEVKSSITSARNTVLLFIALVGMVVSLVAQSGAGP